MWDFLQYILGRQPKNVPSRQQSFKNNANVASVEDVLIGKKDNLDISNNDTNNVSNETSNEALINVIHEKTLLEEPVKEEETLLEEPVKEEETLLEEPVKEAKKGKKRKNRV